MDMKNLFFFCGVSAIAAVTSVYTLFSRENTEFQLTKDSRIAFLGDNLTESRNYTKIVDVYLNACAGLKGIQVFQFGRSGETAEGFTKRMDRDMTFWKPDVVTVLYGLNDSKYSPYREPVEKSYLDAMREIVRENKKNGARVVVASPTCVDTDTFRRNEKGMASKVNGTLSKFSRAAFELAIAETVPFADVNTVFADTMKRAKEKYGDKYHLAGHDGVHPWNNGHFVIAYTFLKTFGMAKTPIADLVLDMSGKGSVVSPGHTILSEKPGELTLESTRYPYCFRNPDPKKQNDPGEIHNLFAILPFQSELNRFRFRVTNLQLPRVKLQWGKYSKEYTREELEKGINLAAEFPENPFSGDFERVCRAVDEKQNFENQLFRVFEENRQFAKRLGISEEGSNAFDVVIREIRKKHDDFQKKVTDSVKPVKHTIQISAPKPGK